MKKRFFKNSFNLIYSKLRFEKGFMLAEVLIVIAIILVFTSVIMVNHREGQKKVLLERAAHKLAQDIRVTEEMALSGRECLGCGKVPDSYGIYLEKDSDEYAIYADMNGNELYDSPSADRIIETISLERGVFIKAIDPIPAVDPAPDNICINFIPPDPEITMKWEGDQTTQIIITIALTADPTKTKTINVNVAGLINIVGSNSAPPPSGVCGGGDIFGNVPCDDEFFGNPILTCAFSVPDTCTPCGCWCSFFQCKDPGVGGPILCSDLDESLCNFCECTWSG